MTILILGAGIVGVSAALHLQAEGHAVTLIDHRPPGEGASFGNAGCLNPSSVVPMAMPGMLRNVPKWLLDPLGPLAIRPTYLPQLAPWLWRFWRTSDPARVQAIAKALALLLADTVAQHRALETRTHAADIKSGFIEQRGHLFAYTTEAGFAADAPANQLRRDQGINITELDQAQLRALEPTLAPSFIRGRYFAQNGHINNPGAWVKALAAAFVARGGRLLQARACGFVGEGSAINAVQLESGEALPCSHAVIATGAWSKQLAAQCGDRVPLDTERGYHLMLHQPAVMPSVPTLWVESKVMATPMATGLRFASMVEFAGLDAPPNWARADAQLKLGKMMLPGLATHPEGMPEDPIPEQLSSTSPTMSRWLGFRPSMPDSLPVIGTSSRFANVVYAFGHGHIGLASGPMTGCLVADLIAKRQPRIPIEPFSPRRF